MVSDVAVRLSDFLQVLESAPFLGVFVIFVVLQLWYALCDALGTVCYCIRMHFYEKAILAAKDCDKLVVRPPLRLWKKFSVCEVSENGENTPRK